MKHFVIYTAAACIFLLTSCTKEVVTQPALAPHDLSGQWNAYGYYDFSGLVPIEVIEITKTDNNYFTATKIWGDNAVPTGQVTWHGRYDQNPFPVKIITGDGKTLSSADAEIEVQSPDVMVIKGTTLTLIRRTDIIVP